MDDPNSNENELYLYLDFGGNLKNDVFEEPIYLQIANMHKLNPLVQINDKVFKGTFDNAMGTNMFFESSEVQIKPDANTRKAPIDLKYITSQTKVLNLEPVKIKPKRPEIPKEQLQITYNLKWDYATLLKKWDDGTLELKDLIKDMKVVPPKEKQNLDNVENDNEDEEENPVESEHQEENKKKPTEADETSEKELLLAYEKLKLLAQRPVKRKPVEETVQDCEDKYIKSYELHNIQKQVLQPSDAFRSENYTEFDENALSEHVDINKCILYGILKPSSTFPRILTSEERKAVFTIENFDNLSLTGRFYVINEIVNKLEQQLEHLSEDKLQQKDEFGRTPIETLDIYKRLKECLGRKITAIKFTQSDEE